MQQKLLLQKLVLDKYQVPKSYTVVLECFPFWYELYGKCYWWKCTGTSVVKPSLKSASSLLKASGGGGGLVAPFTVVFCYSVFRNNVNYFKLFWRSIHGNFLSISKKMVINFRSFCLVNSRIISPFIKMYAKGSTVLNCLSYLCHLS